jgi:hypothetical protein
VKELQIVSSFSPVRPKSKKRSHIIEDRDSSTGMIRMTSNISRSTEANFGTELLVQSRANTASKVVLQPVRGAGYEPGVAMHQPPWALARKEVLTKLVEKRWRFESEENWKASTWRPSTSFCR